MKSSLGRKLINAPYLIWAALFILIPLIIVAYYAFTDTQGNFSFEYIVKIGEYKEVLIRSLVYAAVATAITLVMAYPVAYYMSRSKVSTQKMMMLLVMLPMWMNLLIRTYSWTTILEKTGLINSFLDIFGIGPFKIIGTSGAVILGMVYNYVPYM
ncbi:MAG: ABC transporter permease, partial [Acutalibacteraceae bacterium]|nr:ABC transporter permease [Acutalibacteraceae bacterium]